MIFVDSNIPMYLIGGEHLLKHEARRLLDECVARGERLLTDAEVLQELLHRYAAIRRRDFIQPAFTTLLGMVDGILPIQGADVERAKTILLGSIRLSSRDALHLAVMERAGIGRILSFDTGFDGYPGVERIG